MGVGVWVHVYVCAHMWVCLWVCACACVCVTYSKCNPDLASHCHHSVVDLVNRCAVHKRNVCHVLYCKVLNVLQGT